MIINDLFNNKKIAVAEAGFPGAPDVEMPPMKPSGDPERDKLKKEYVDLHREIKSLVDAAYGGDKRAKARIAQLNDRADQIRAILEPRQPPNEWQKKTYGYDDNWNIVKKGVAEGYEPNVVVKFSAKEYAAMSPEQKAAKQREWQQLKRQAKKRLQNFTLVDADKEQGVAEGGIATVDWPADNGSHSNSRPPVNVGGTFDARPVVKRGSLVKASGLTGVYRVMDILRDEAKIVQEIPRTGVSTYVPMSDLRVWTNKPIREQGMAETNNDTGVKWFDFATWVLKQGDKYKGFTTNHTVHQAAQKAYKAYVNSQKQGMAEGKKPDNYHIVNKDGKPASLASYADRASAEKDRDEKHPGAEVRQVGPRGKVKNVSEVSLGDYRKKATVNKAMAQTNRFFDRDDPAKVAAADQTIAKREKGLARADARAKAYTPPPAAPADLEKQQRDLTAKYPNIDELVRRAELNRDPNYEMADGQAYYAARDAEQNYQKLRQIQRVIQGLNESLNRSHLP